MIITSQHTRNYLAAYASYWLARLEGEAPKYPLTGLRADGKVMSLVHPATCLIGELHGCSSDYAFHEKKLCDACNNMGAELLELLGVDASPVISIAMRNLNVYLDKVVDHFIVVHPEADVHKVIDRLIMGRPEASA